MTDRRQPRPGSQPMVCRLVTWMVGLPVYNFLKEGKVTLPCAYGTVVWLVIVIFYVGNILFYGNRQISF